MFVTTVRRAVSLLEDSGFLKRRHGSGTFIGEALRIRKVGLLVPEADYSQFFHTMAIRMSPELRQRGYSPTLFVTGGDHFELATMESDLRSMDALILCGYGAEAGELRRIGVPYVVLGNEFPREDTYVATDMISGMMMAMRHLYATGCRKIIYLGNFHWNSPLAQEHLETSMRYLGFRLALHELGLEFSPGQALAAGYSSLHGYERVLRLVDESEFDALLCATDQLAQGAIQALLGRNLRIPEEVSVVGCNNLLPETEYLVPLTAIDFNLDQFAAQAVYLLNRKLDGTPEEDVFSLFLRPKLVCRASTRPLSGR